MTGGCGLIASGGHCADIDSVVLWGGWNGSDVYYVGFNDWSEGGGHWQDGGQAELTLPDEDRERIWNLLVEAGRKLREIEAIGEEWRERLVAEGRLASSDRDVHRFRRPQPV